MNTVLGELQVYVLVPSMTNINIPTSNAAETTPIHNSTAEYKWSVNNTKLLIDSYAKCRKRVGTFDIKNVKMMWQRIADELHNLNINVTASNCHNRWKVLERNYKKFVDNQNKTGRGRKYFEYQVEMEEIFGKKKNINPEVLLSSETVDYSLEENEKINTEEETKENNSHKRKIKNSIELCETPPKVPLPQPTTTSVTNTKHRKNRRLTNIENLRLDRKMYYEQKLEIEREKLKLIAERNEILRNWRCKCQCNIVDN
ncbi:uncharacterized protein [Leptinotarsa decemlineata]|uniref:uncharacterized protein n=1 Tax=Leptinotarsa decemlineata TaxID=7539 RepID=UPI003D3084DB